MSGSSHNGLSPRGSYDPAKGRHPDLDENDNPQWDVYWTKDVDERDFNRTMIDPVQREHVMAHIAASQRQEHPQVQEFIGGREFGSTPAEGIRNYRAQLGVERQYVAEAAGKSMYVDDAWVARASLEEYDRAFDENGQPREHVYYFQNRSMRLDDGIDQQSAREGRNVR